MRQLLIGSFMRFSTEATNSHYQVLGVPKEASDEDIKSAYYKLAKQFHPDVRPQFGDKFKQVNQAYNTLKDPVKRNDYDHLNSRAAGKENVYASGKSSYNTHFHYGYTDKFAKQAQAKYNYDNNPFANNYQKAFSNEFTRNMFKKENDRIRTNNLKQMNSNVKNILIIIFSLVSILLLTELILHLYKFNHQKQKATFERSKHIY